MSNTDILKSSALINSKQKLMRIYRIFQTVQTSHLLFATLQPTSCSIYGIDNIFAIRYRTWTLIKRHGNGGTKIGLNLHTLLRSHKNLGTVNMRVEVHTLLLYFAKTCQ